MSCQRAIAADFRYKCVKLIHCFVAVEQIEPTKVLPKLRLDPNLNEVVLEQHSVVFRHKPTECTEHVM